MKIALFNGSPRKNGNTATLLKEVLEGAKSAGAEGDLVHLYSLDFKGCTSCFQCKKLGGKSYGVCAMQDDLTPILKTIGDYDALVIGSPVYFGSETGETRSFFERLAFPYLTYTPGYKSLFPKKIPTALVYTMNVNEAQMKELGYAGFMDRTQGFLERTIGTCERFVCGDTYQFDDYSKYLSTIWDVEAKARRHAEVFPEECRKARELGVRLIESA